MIKSLKDKIKTCNEPMRQHQFLYLIGQKSVGQNCLNFGFMSKILSNEKFSPSKILSNTSIQKPGKNRTKLSKFRFDVENFVRRKILSVENFVPYFNTKVRQKSDKSVEISAWFRKFCTTKYFVSRNFCPTEFCLVRYDSQGYVVVAYLESTEEKCQLGLQCC